MKFSFSFLPSPILACLFKSHSNLRHFFLFVRTGNEFSPSRKHTTWVTLVVRSMSSDGKKKEVTKINLDNVYLSLFTCFARIWACPCIICRSNISCKMSLRVSGPFKIALLPERADYQGGWGEVLGHKINREVRSVIAFEICDLKSSGSFLSGVSFGNKRFW